MLTRLGDKLLFDESSLNNCRCMNLKLFSWENKCTVYSNKNRGDVNGSYHIKLFFKLSFLEIFLYSLGVIPVLFLNIFIKHISFPYPQRSDISLTVISVVER